MVKSFYQNPMVKIADNLIWVIGRSGLLGSALTHKLSENRSDWTLWNPKEIFSWRILPTLHGQFEKFLKAFHQESKNYDRWTIAWTAGVGVIGTQESDLLKETSNFGTFIHLLSQTFGRDLQKGSFFLASSAGGVWGGARNFPIVENTPAAPISEYGKQKLAQESLIKDLTTSNPDFKVLIGRISNLYGPGQNLSKPQGLLSQLCRSALLQVPINIFVPLTTVRDYIHSYDAAGMVLRALQMLRIPGHSTNPTTKIFCSEEDCSISQILSYIHQLNHHEPVISFPENKTTSMQPTELTFRSKVLVDSFRCRPLLEGIHELLGYLETQLQLGNLPFPEAV